ncbi:hypothetical protein A8926_1059 [Saccharopolyspora spinosa]|uniref:Uncharacterized protein n=1 Tax=Saccharopolyspora spinosa TaxID=60894 RepID=A0A2N3XS77_SACSN|nr:hypothetical protein A8926_1059 [Saccharopolyspora spinosa]
MNGAVVNPRPRPTFTGRRREKLHIGPAGHQRGRHKFRGPVLTHSPPPDRCRSADSNHSGNPFPRTEPESGKALELDSPTEPRAFPYFLRSVVRLRSGARSGTSDDTWTA